MGLVGGLIVTARRRIRIAWAAATASALLPIVAIAVSALAVLAWVARRPLPWWAVVGAPLVAVMGIVVIARSQQFSNVQVARALERRAGCDGVLVSALEFTDPDDDWHRAVQERAERVAQEPDVVRTIPIPLDRRRLGIAGAAIVVGAAFGVLSPLGSGGPVVSAEDRAVLDAEAALLEETAEVLEEAADAADPKDQELAAVADELRRFADEIRSAESPSQAADELERAAEALRERAGEDFLARKAAVEGLEQQLSAAPLTAGGGDASSQLDALSAQLTEMSAQELEELAQRLEALAQSQTAANSPVAEALSNAAQEIRAGQLGAASTSLGAASAGQRDARARVRDGAVADAAASVASASAARLRDPNAARSASGSGSGNGDGNGDGGGDGDGNGNGQGNGSGSGSGTGGQAGNGGPSGQVGGATPGAGGSSGQGGVGAPGFNDSPHDTTSVNRATVFDPAAGGESVELQVGMEGGQGDGQVIGRQDGMTMSGTALVPYSDVLPRYLADAATALDELRLPAEMRSVVRDYFDGLARGGGG